MITNMKGLHGILLLFINLSILYAEDCKISSPDGKASLTVHCDKGNLSYTLAWENEIINEKSTIHFFKDDIYSLDSFEQKKINTSWKPTWGQFSEIHDECNQLILHLVADYSGFGGASSKIDLICQLYNDGMGIRFSVPAQEWLKGKKILYQIGVNMPKDIGGYFFKGKEGVKGPMKISEWRADTNEVNQRIPVVFEYSSEKHLAYLESDLYTAKLFKTTRLMQSTKSSFNFASPIVVLKDNKGFVSPWKVILFEKKVGDLVMNNVAVNLAAPCKLKDTQWIKAGKGLWDWRIHGYDNGDFPYDINTKSYLRMIDFASEYGIEYLTIDDHWFESAKDGEMHISPEVDIKKVVAYAKSKNVKIILYYDRHKGDYGDDKLFAFYNSLSSAGIKYGFMGNKADFTRNAIDEAAKEHLLIFFHDGPVPMSGAYRTMPNMVSREYCHGQQDYRTAFTPTNFIKMALVNAISGPLDQSNGNFGINSINARVRKKGPKVKDSYISTVVSEVARTLIIFSGLITLPDAPEEYRKKADLFQFLKEMPATWDESIVIQSKMGEYISTARRSGDTWFVGTANNESERTLDVSLDFLDPKKKYKATIFQDTDDAHGLKNPEVYEIKKQKVDAKMTIEAKMAVGGGHAMIIKLR